jgi:AcrR family transcriptional regulator
MTTRRFKLGLKWLLDTAERLFDEHGYDAGMRALAEEAKVNLGTAIYHYSSEEALCIKTFMRRFRPANARPPIPHPPKPPRE